MMWKQIILGYLAVMNAAAFLMMGIDKRRARKKLWRIPEKSLFGAAILGGSIGAVLGMRLFHHKTKHWYFVWGMPLILILQVVVAAVIWRHWMG